MMSEVSEAGDVDGAQSQKSRSCETASNMVNLFIFIYLLQFNGRKKSDHTINRDRKSNIIGAIRVRERKAKFDHHCDLCVIKIMIRSY